MNSSFAKMIVLGAFALRAAWLAQAQDAKSPYPKIAPRPNR